MSPEDCKRSREQHPPSLQHIQDQIRSACEDLIHCCSQEIDMTFYQTEQSLHIRRDLSGSGLLTIVCKRFLIRELEDRFESQSRASRSGIALGVSPFGVSPQIVDHRLE